MYRLEKVRKAQNKSLDAPTPKVILNLPIEEMSLDFLARL
jgi:hypothetical protein